MATKEEVLTAMQYTSLFGTKVNREIGGTSEGVDALKVITYRFADTTQPVDFISYDRSGWTAFSASDKAAVLKAMALMEGFLNVSFVEAAVADEDPDLNLGKLPIAGPTEGTAGYSKTTAIVDVDPDPDVIENQTQITQFDSYALFDSTLDLDASFSRVLQILGHAMGLKNSFVGPTVPDGTDNHKYTVMSNQVDPGTGELSQTYQIFDIIALQDLWGANVSANAGDTAYLGDTADAVQLVVDASGTDIFDASGQTEAVTLDLDQGASSVFDANHELMIAYDTVIENATGGAGDDTISGNDEDNVLKGGKGKDVLTGQKGADVLRGNNGKDTLRGDLGADILQGGNSNDKLFGGKGNDTLNGGNGDDLIRGGAGKDQLTGGTGADNFVFIGDTGENVITDFENDIDTLKIDRTDVSTTAEALAFAQDVGGNVVFTFDDGSTISVNGITIADLTDDITIA